VIVGVLPAATAVAAVLRAGEHPSRGFWLASLAGLAAVLVFASTQGAGVSAGDLQILVAVALGAIGYAEGGTLAREMGGWRVICWAVLLSAPLTVPIGAIEELREDTKGLFVGARMHDNARVEPIRQAIASGAIDGMSFRFRVIREEWDESGDIPVRTINEVELFEPLDRADEEVRTP